MSSKLVKELECAAQDPRHRPSHRRKLERALAEMREDQERLEEERHVRYYGYPKRVRS
jgi:hypothetical protein